MTDHESAIRATFPELEVWRGRAAAGYLPSPESDLAVDDEDWPWWRLSQLALAGLAAGREHLSAVAEHLERGEGFPFAHRTLVRTGILGAAQGVWLLAPNEQNRRVERARTMAAEVYERHGAFLKDLRQVSEEPHEGTEIVTKIVAGRAQELSVLRESAGQRAKFNSTQIIEEAVRETLGDALVAEARCEWRRGSGAAHGLPWALLGVPSTAHEGEPDEQGMTNQIARGGWDSVANGYLLAYHLLRRGWALLDQRGTATA